MKLGHSCTPTRFSTTIMMFTALSAVSVIGGPAASAQPGWVLAHQKISDTQGDFAGVLHFDDQFGISVAPLGDLDGDGVADLVVGARGDDDGGVDRGAVWVLFLNGDGTVRSHQKISDTEGGFSGTSSLLHDGDNFGTSVASVGDLNGDGAVDLAVGAWKDGDGGVGHGAVWILFLNNDGTVDSHQKISDTEGGFEGILDLDDWFGTSVASLGDLDGNGVSDLAVGAFFDDDGESDSGAVWILFLTSHGTVNAYQKISSTAGGFTGDLNRSDFFGWSVASLGDLDGDSVGDLAVGAFSDDDGGTDHGAVWMLFLHPDGRVKSHQKISDTQGEFAGVLENNDQFGVAVETLGDLNGDGITDLAVGANGDGDGGLARGAVWALFLRADGTVESHQKISDTQGGFTGTLNDIDSFGVSVGSLGDLDGDGIIDLAVGAPYDNDGGQDRGAAWVLFLDGCHAPSFSQGVEGISFGDQAFDGFIDARRESVDGTTTIGLEHITVRFTTPMENNDGSPLSAAAFSIIDTAGTAPSIADISTLDGQTVTLELTDHLTTQAWTTITVNARSQCNLLGFSGVMNIGYLPGDVDQNGCVNAFDLLKFKQFVNGAVTAPIGVIEDFIDTNRNGSINPLDLIAYKRLIGGIPPATQAWASECLPAQP